MSIIRIATHTPSLDSYRKSIQDRLDAKAQERGYDNGHTISTYVNSTVPSWAIEAQAFVTWRDDVWMFAYAELARVEAGERQAPSPEAFCAELPPFNWPQSST